MKLYGLTPSMSGKANCWDNAVTETLFGSLKVERLHGERFMTVRAAKDAVMNWILWYKQERMHSTIGYQSPVEFQQATPTTVRSSGTGSASSNVLLNWQGSSAMPYLMGSMPAPHAPGAFSRSAEEEPLTLISSCTSSCTLARLTAFWHPNSMIYG